MGREQIARGFSQSGDDSDRGPSQTDAEEPGMGIRFIYTDEAQRDSFENVVQGLMNDSLGEVLASRLLRKGEPS